MNTRRSYIDTVNAGRQRKSESSLEQLSRSLEHLEQQLEMRDRQPAPRTAAVASHNPRPTASAQEPRKPAFGRSDPFAADTISAEMRALRDEMRQQMNAGLRREFETLRDDIRQTQGAAYGRDSATITSGMERLADTVHTLAERHDDKSLTQLRAELQQVTSNIAALAREETVQSVGARWDDIDRKLAHLQSSLAAPSQMPDIDPAFAALNERLDQIGMSVNRLPESLSINKLEDKVRNLASAIDHFSKNSAEPVESPAITAIENRLEEISRAIVATSMSNAAPAFDAAPFDRIEARLNGLARQFAETASPTDQLLDRLNALSIKVEELSHNSGAPDEAIERLTRHIGALTEKIAVTVGQSSSGASIHELEDRLAAIMQRLEDTASAPALDTAFDGLDRRLSAIVRRLDERPASVNLKDETLQGLDQRLHAIVRRLDETPAVAAGAFAETALNGLDERLAAIARRLDETPSAAPNVDDALRGLDQRLSAIARRLEETPQALPAVDAMLGGLDQRLDLIARKLEEGPSGAHGVDSALQDLDNRIAQIARKLDETPAPSSVSEEAIIGLQKRLEFLAKKIETPAMSASGDSDVLRALEGQLGALTGYLADARNEATELTPRLDRLESSIAQNQDSMVKAAREAAELAVRNISAGSGDAAAVAGLAQDLKTLEALARKSDDRNAKTFDAVHDTLMKIVDRLGALDGAALAGKTAEAPRRFGMDDTPSLAVDQIDAGGPFSNPARRAPAPGMSAAQMAAAAAAAALSEIEAGAPAAAPTARAPRQPAAAPRRPAMSAAPLPGMAAQAAAPEVTLDAPIDPAIANQPLEPGAGAPDLTAILNRARGEASSARKEGQESVHNEFLAAARRAAQAAAAEAEIVKRQSDPSAKRSKGSILDLLKKKRKLILMGAAAVVAALLAAQFGRQYLPGGEASLVAAPAVIEQAAPEAPAAQPKAEQSSAVRVIDDKENAVSASTTASIPPREATASADRFAGEDSLEDAGPQASAPEAASAPASAPAAAPAAAAVNPTEPSPERMAALEPAPEAKPAAPVKLEVPKTAGSPELRKAASDGDAKAMFEVGARLAEGRGTKADPKAAAAFYEQSAEQGFAPAQYRIGNFYEKGIGVERDLQKAKTWYQMSADQGNASAMHNLAVLFASGGQMADNDAAVTWFNKAANLGVKDSQYNLGILSGKGIGMKQNLEESYKWFALLAKAGDHDAEKKRDEIASSMMPDQIAKARAAAEGWKPEQLNAAANSVDLPESWREAEVKTASVDMKKAVRNVQALLNKAGYDAGAADGSMGEKTKKAIAKFQKDNGMQASGQIDEQTVKALLGRG